MTRYELFETIEELSDKYSKYKQLEKEIEELLQRTRDYNPDNEKSDVVYKRCFNCKFQYYKTESDKCRVCIRDPKHKNWEAQEDQNANSN